MHRCTNILTLQKYRCLYFTHFWAIRILNANFVFAIKMNADGTGPAYGRGVGTSRRQEVAGKEGRGRIQYKKCVHMYANAKIVPVAAIPGMGKEG
jgi:hypothetical protein